MKRLGALAVLMLMGSAAQAGTISFSVGGHRIRIEAPRGCSSSSCASISIPGVYESRNKRDDDTRNLAVPPPPAPAPAPAQVAPLPAPAPVQPPAPPKPVVAAAPVPVPPAVYTTAATSSQEVAPQPRPLPPVPQIQPAASVTQSCTAPPAGRPDESARPAPPVLKVTHEQDPDDSPLGDWQTEGKGMVRVTECGSALCGYAISDSKGEKGEAVLINMKPKANRQWNGSVYSKDSGDTYYGTMGLRGPDTLHVEACAFGRFYCNGNDWVRIRRPESMMSSRQVTERPRS